MPILTIRSLATLGAFFVVGSMTNVGMAATSNTESIRSQPEIIAPKPEAPVARLAADSVNVADQQIVDQITARLGVESLSPTQFGALYRLTVLRQEGDEVDAIKSALGGTVTGILFPNGELNHAAAAAIRNLILQLSAGYRDRLAAEAI